MGWAWNNCATGDWWLSSLAQSECGVRMIRVYQTWNPVFSKLFLLFFFFWFWHTSPKLGGGRFLVEPTVYIYGCFQKIGGFHPPKWMIYFMENPVKIDDLGVPLFLETYIFWHVLLASLCIKNNSVGRFASTDLRPPVSRSASDLGLAGRENSAQDLYCKDILVVVSN